MVELISVIEKYKIKNFILEHYFEFGDIPADHFFMKVAEGYIVHDSLVFDEDDEVSEQNYLRMHQHKKISDWKITGFPKQIYSDMSNG
ncbi:hypothetical protein FY557_19245 [Chryseobacterium sp. SN22]|uniref:hypothetical protein n=1 Tax=Chryseobacterium sp. SN22 TaxID=2606431 RepID=UPI0011ED8140|nr:hypothetical protein [Chryseobacterium sp. SN22]KAA0126061.1 hypothetical protein FY557_19245 [Chryseobacterium sp. SN22]